MNGKNIMLQVSEEDLLPKSLCYRCIYNLENFYEFRKGCVDAVNRLENYVNETWGNALELQYKPQKNNFRVSNNHFKSIIPYFLFIIDINPFKCKNVT